MSEPLDDDYLADIEADLGPGGYSATYESDLPLFSHACALLDEVRRLRAYTATSAAVSVRVGTEDRERIFAGVEAYWGSGSLRYLAEPVSIRLLSEQPSEVVSAQGQNHTTDSESNCIAEGSQNSPPKGSEPEFEPPNPSGPVSTQLLASEPGSQKGAYDKSAPIDRDTGDTQ